LPFECEFYARHGMRARFVGHPLADTLDAALPAAPARAALGVAASQRCVAVLPGSRASEIAALCVPFAKTLHTLAGRHPNLVFLLPVAEPSLHEPIARCLLEHAGGVPVRLLEGRSREAMAAADVVLLASGTATLEAMLIGRPMVVAYRLSALTSWLLRFVTPVRIRHFSLPNLLAGEALVPELLQDALTVEALVEAVEARLNDAAGNAVLLRRFDALRDTLAHGADARAAQAVLEHARAAGAPGA
jgi:lipid-A-disaccharide synthase